MYYTVYKITNIVNNKIYIGCHRTEDLNDQYMGSGKVLKRSIKKYGIESFKKEYLHIFDNKEDMFEMELTLVNADFIKEVSNYNLKVGGEGGWDYANENNLAKNKEHGYLGGMATGKRFQNDSIFRDKTKNRLIKSTKNAHQNGKYKNIYFGECEWQNKAIENAQSHESREKRKNTYKKIKFQQGKNNSQYGMMWICNLELKENKKIKKDSIIPDGWVKGRKLKF